MAESGAEYRVPDRLTVWLLASDCYTERTMAQTADIASSGGRIVGMRCAGELARQREARIVLFGKTMIAGATTGGSAGVICLHDLGAVYAQPTLLGDARIRELRREHDYAFQPWGALSLVYEGGAWPPPNPYAARFDDGAPDSIYAHELLDRGAVLNAGGLWGAKIAALAGSAVALMPQRIQVRVATAFDDGLTAAPLTGVPESVDGEGVWYRGELGGTLLFGQHHNLTTPGYTAGPDYVNRINDEGYPVAVERVYRRYWELPYSVFLNGWCCVSGTTEDGFPIISRDERLANFFHALGMNGHCDDLPRRRRAGGGGTDAARRHIDRSAPADRAGGAAGFRAARRGPVRPTRVAELQTGMIDR
jgi:glycine/D-amino acid oxidase-like deaminating enzyme